MSDVLGEAAMNGTLGAIALVLFFGVFLAILVRVSSRKLDDEYNEAAQLPLRED
jgi:cbb3-type cytochrome oxidase subunit 3